MRVTVYGSGGFDPKKANGNVIEENDLPDPAPTAQDEALAVIEAVRDPKVADPSVAQRLAALEALVAPSGAPDPA